MEQPDGWCKDLIERDSALCLAAAEVACLAMVEVKGKGHLSARLNHAVLEGIGSCVM